MAGELNGGSGRYWILFYQPLPEAGERLAVALVFEERVGRATIKYDSTFSKVAKLFPTVDAQALAFCLDSMQADLNGSTNTETILNSYGPQVAASSPRRISVPAASSTIDMLMDRYIHPEKKPKKIREHKNNAATEIEAFVRTRIGPNLPLRTHVSAKDILGQSVTGTKAVALAVRRNTGWTLIDGVDLNQLSPQAAVSRADEISRTFWNYGRAASQLGIQIKRVGVVLNGSSHLAVTTHEAHDYALHRFKTESDAAIDGASTEATERLREVLQDTSGT